ncbi:hypothetical protein CleRT_06680 [Candidatus Coxiella mudrowiae]|uniref:Transposase n=1 Tax=Candidatus Coxiella mudrowiae TaxID=2054173 RepID=A0ABM5UTX0_9COXI|nr:hypothetical protein CleRT_05240 [Candidatus Coxiella mudrowiae]AKQ33523.1 hypothetical protein CleRT_06680 [Candidatus Coxiella mudrowiae]
MIDSSASHPLPCKVRNISHKNSKYLYVPFVPNLVQYPGQNKKGQHAFNKSIDWPEKRFEAIARTLLLSDIHGDVHHTSPDMFSVACCRLIF